MLYDALWTKVELASVPFLVRVLLLVEVDVDQLQTVSEIDR